MASIPSGILKTNDSCVRILRPGTGQRWVARGRGGMRRDGLVGVASVRDLAVLVSLVVGEDLLGAVLLVVALRRRREGRPRVSVKGGGGKGEGRGGGRTLHCLHSRHERT